MHDAPLVSCIVATHNRRHMVVEAVDSVLQDPHPALEVIVVVDGSTDGTVEVLEEEYGSDERVRVLVNRPGVGGGRARNRGIDAAQGGYITFLDDDDLNIPGRIADQVRLAIEHQADFVTCTRCVYETSVSSAVQGPVMDRVRLRDMWFRNPIVSVSPLVSRSLMMQVRFDPDFPAAQDYDAWIRCLKACERSVNYSKPCIRYRRLDSVTVTKDRSKKRRARDLFYQRHKHLMPWYARLWFRVSTVVKIVVPDPRFALAVVRDRLGGSDGVLEDD